MDDVELLANLNSILADAYVGLAGQSQQNADRCKAYLTKAEVSLEAARGCEYMQVPNECFSG